VPKIAVFGVFAMDRDLLTLEELQPGGKPMPNRKHDVRVLAQRRDHPHDHHQLLWAALCLGAVVLLFNAWLISQNLIGS
jgi:hypothetical protein